MTDRPDRSRLARDVALAALVVVSVWTVTALADEPLSRPVGPAGWALGPVLGALQFVRRRHPVAVLTASVAAVFAYHLLGYPAIGVVWPLLLPFLSAASSGYLRYAVALAVASSVGTAGWRIVAEGEDPIRVLVGEAQGIVVVGLALAVGEAIWQRRRWADEVRRRLALAREEARREGDRRLTGQRLAVAADLHDVAAHSLVVIGLQLRLAEETLGEDGPACRAAIAAALAAHEEAVRETTRTVRLLREASAAPLLPAPTLADLDRLPEVARRAGLDLRMDLDPGPDVPASVALAAYRIAQEALTNTLKHADAARASLTVRRDGGDLHVRFVDQGGGGTSRRAARGGYGISGMRERVRGLGGRLEAGPGRDGGFRVDAWLPVREG